MEKRPKIAATNISIAGAVLAMGMAGGCIPGPSREIDDPEPLASIPAMKRAGDQKDMKQAGKLVEQLESDDYPIRFYAIGALEKYTHDDFGYIPYKDESLRRPAVERWKDWLKRQENGT